MNKVIESIGQFFPNVFKKFTMAGMSDDEAINYLKKRFPIGFTEEGITVGGCDFEDDVTYIHTKISQFLVDNKFGEDLECKVFVKEYMVDCGVTF